MDKNGSGAGRPPRLPPRPAGSRQAARPPPPPASRKITASRQALAPHSGPKPEPEPPAQAKNAFRETLGEKAYENLKAALRAICRVSGASLQQFRVAQDSLLFFPNPPSQEHSVFGRIEFLGGTPEFRIYFDDAGWGRNKPGMCRAIMKECGQGDASEAMVLLLTGMGHTYLRVLETGVFICAARSRDGQPSIYFALHLA